MKVTIEELLGDIEVDCPILTTVGEKCGNQAEYEQLLKNNPNSIVLCQTHAYAMSDREAADNPPKYKAFINLIKLLANEFATDPYWNSRIGWMMWFWVCYARHDSYYPMGWCYHYDPLNWYRSDEPMRPDGLERVMPNDPFNVKGECFVHPDWYKLKKETGKENWNANTSDT